MSWYIAQNSNSVKPEAIETNSSNEIVFVRKDFNFVPELTEGDRTTPAHWKYMERQIAKGDYDIYADLQKAKADLDYIAMMTDVFIPVNTEA